MRNTYRAKNGNALYDSNVEHILQYTNGRGFCLISAYEEEFSIKVNQRRHEELKKRLHHAEIRFLELDGFWTNSSKKQKLSLFIPYPAHLHPLMFSLFSQGLLKNESFRESEIILQNEGSKEIELINGNNEVTKLDEFILDDYNFTGIRVPSGGISARMLAEQGYLV